MIIDAHQHFWQYDPVKHDWINEEMQVLRKDFLPDSLAKIYKAQSIDGCVAVQADQSEAETTFLVQLAREYDFIKGVVGWTDLRSPRLAERLAAYAKMPELSGFRHIVQAEPDPRFLMQKDFLEGIRQLAPYHFTYDILVYPHQLDAVLDFVRLFPNQAFIIDHLAKPYIKDGNFTGWANQMRQIALSPHIYCKVSGMVTEADWQNWQYEDFVPYLDLVFEVFGTDRLVFGSDWPVCLLAGNYPDIKGILHRYLEPFPETERQKIWSQNALDFYGLN